MYHLRKLKCMLLLMFAVVTANAQLESGKVYNFVNVGNSGKSMVITSNGMATITATDTQSYDQLWYVSGNAEDGYSLRNLERGHYLRSSNATSARWTLVKGDDMDDNCKFSCVQAGSGYTLRAKNDENSHGYMHYGANNGGIVCWESGATASQWTMNVVEVSAEDLTANWNKLASIDPDAATVATYQTHLDNLFTDKACTTPKKSLTTEEDIIDDADYQSLPEALQKMVLKVYLDNWAEENYDNNKSGWDADYAKKYRVQMYEPYNEPAASASALGINAHTNLNNPTGIFANLEQPLYVMVEGEIKDGASLYLASYVGHAQLGEYNDGIELHEGLNVVPSFLDGNNYCINYVVHTFDTSDGKRGNKAKARKLSDYSDLKIHIEGGYINGYWNKVGDELYAPDKAANWDYIETRATQTDVTVLGEYMALQFPLGMDADGNNGLSYYFNDKVDINAAIDAWDNIMRWERIVLGILHKDTIEKYAEESPYSDKPYVFESTANDGDDFATDYSDYYNMHGLAIGDNSTYMSGGWKSSNYNCNTLESIIQHLPTDAGSHWGPAHEIGHQHQAMIKMGGEMEVSNNLFSNVVMWYFGKTTSRVNGTNGLLSSVLANFNKEDGHYLTNSIWGMTQMYYKLFLYYHVLGHNPKFYPRLFEMLRQDPQQQGGGAIDGANAQLHLYKKVCQAAGEDLTEFFRAHGFFVPLDGFSINDYGIYTFYMTQEQIDEAIAEVKAWAEANGVEENTAILFINDVTGEEIISHKGNVLTLHGETTTLADLGSYATFDEATQSDYTYSVVGNTVTMEGTGGVGFAIYNAEGEIIAFSNNKTFEISDECAALIASGEAEFKVVNANNTVTEPVDVMDTDDTESKYAALGELLEEVEKILALSDDTDKTYPGFYRGGAVATLKSLYTSASEVYTNKTTASYTSAYESLYQEYVNVVTLDSDKVPFLSGSTYVLTNKLHSGKSMTINNKDTLYCAATNINDAKQQWVFEPATDEDTYYLKNVGNNKYLRTLSKSGKTDALANSTADVLPYKLFDLGEGLWALQCQNKLEEKVSLHCDNSSNIVGWWHTASDNDGSWWYLTATNVVETDLPRYELENLVQKTEALMAEVGKVAVGEANALTLTESNYYCNAECKETTYGDQFTSYLVLCDGDPSTFLHTDYSDEAPAEDHYIRMDVGVGCELQMFSLNYTTRGSGNLCAPTKLAVEASNDANTWVTLREITSGLPESNNTSYTIENLGNGIAYRYIRMRVYGNSTGQKKNEHYYFIVSELGLSKVNYTAVLNDAYANKIASDELLAAFETMQEAKGVLATEATAEYVSAYKALKTKYDALLAARKDVDDAALNAKKAELQTLIDNTTSLISSCGTVTYTPVTYSGDVALQVNNSTGDFYLTTNSQQSNDLSVENLLDNATDTYYHSSWSAAADDDHYLQVNLGEGKGLAEFTFTYTTRGTTAYPSPAPTKIQVYGSNDGESFEALLATFTSSDEDNALPAYNEWATEWTSTSIKGAESYDYLRFYVREAQGPGTDEVEGNGHHYFAMSEFSLTAIGTPESYTVELGNDAGGATNALMLAAYKENASAQATHTLATTLSQVEEAIAKLQADYDALKSAKETIVEKTYYVQVVGGNANGGVEYDGNNYMNTASFKAPKDLTVGALTAIPLDGYAEAVVTLNGTTITVTYNKVYTVQVDGGDDTGGVIYDNNNYLNGSTITVLQDIDAAQLEAIAVSGYNNVEVTLNGTTITVTYRKIYTVQVAGVQDAGGVSFGGSGYAHEATITVLQDIDEAQLTAQNVSGYNAGVITVDHETKVITVTYTMTPLVDSEKFYTLECLSEYAHSTERFISDNGTVINGRSAEGSLFQFEAVDEYNGYYIKSYVTDKYLNHADGAVYASTEKATVWTMAVPSHTTAARTLTVGDNLYLNNNGSDCSDGTCTNLQSLDHTSQGGAPLSGNACSLWTITEGTPLDKSALEALITATNTLIESCYTDEEFNYAGSLNVTEELMTATREAVAAAQEKYDSKATTKSEYEAALTALQTVKDNLETAIAYATLPVKLTYDANSPVTYKIAIARSDLSVLAYDESSAMVAVSDFKLGNKAHGWYFMAATDGKVLIMPYYDDNTTLALSTNSFSEGNSKVKGMAVGSDGYTQGWTITNANMSDANRNAGWYNITCTSNGTDTWYFSNHGGESQKMGFYNDANDGGSRFKFEEITFDKSEAYYTLYNYYMSDTKVASNTITGNDAVGYYPVDAADAYNTAYGTATAVLENTTATDEDYTNAYNALVAANEALEINMPEEGKYYRFVSVVKKNDETNSYANVYANPEDNKMYWAADKATGDATAMWTFVPLADGKFAVTNLHTGSSINTFINYNPSPLGETAGEVSIVSLSLDGQIGIKCGDRMMHAQGGGAVVHWETGADDGSAWRIVEVEDMSSVNYAVNVGKYGHTSLYLNYPVTIPEGVKAYIIDGTDIDIDADGVGTLKLTQLTGNVLPAQTAAIVEAPQGEYSFSYTTVAATDDVESNLLTGSAYVTYREAEEGHNYYIFGVGNTEGVDAGVVGLYKNFVEYTAAGVYAEEGTEDATHYKMSANKVLFDWSNSGQQVTSFRFSVDGDATGIDNIGADGNAVIYDLYGRRILEVVSSGIYIINGEKRYVHVK